MNVLLNERSNRPKGFLKFAPNYDKWDDVVEDFCKLDAVLNCEASNKNHPHWEEEYKKYDFLVYVRREDFMDQRMVKMYSKMYSCNIAVIGFKMEDDVEYEEIILEALNNTQKKGGL